MPGMSRKSESGTGSASSAASASAKKFDYQALSQELDTILEELQTADLDIDEAVKKYERGMTIVKDLETYLKTAENKVTKLKARFEG